MSYYVKKQTDDDDDDKISQIVMIRIHIKPKNKLKGTLLIMNNVHIRFFQSHKSNLI